MFLEHFGFREQPFGPTPDPRFLYCSAQHTEALAALHYGLSERRGFLVLVAPPGCGKTTLLHYLLERWKNRAETAFVFHPPETREQMIASIVGDLGLAGCGDYVENRRMLEARALDCCRRGRRLLLVFDEAQGIPLSVLEEIRLLSNFETTEEKLVEVILAGQTTLAERLRLPEYEQLRQRVGVWAHIGTLDQAEVRRYVVHRLRLAGLRRSPVLTRRALDLLAGASQGIPRNINAVCFEALSTAFSQGKKRVDEEEIRCAVAALCPALPARPEAHLERAPGWAAGAAAVVLAVGTLLATAYFHRISRTPRPPAQVLAVPRPAATGGQLHQATRPPQGVEP